MATITDYFAQAQLSLAAYALDLQQGMSGSFQKNAYVTALKVAGMTDTQAASFASTYTVVAQSGGLGSLTGFSATLFQDTQGNKYLAIRGTEITSGPDLWADASLAFGTLLLNAQIPAMLSFYNQLKTDGLVASTDMLTVSGHSLGGYLAQLLTVYDPTQISQTCTYNAPGFTGAFGLAATLLGLSNSVIPSQITNVQGIGPNVIAGLGAVIGSEQAVFTEGATHSIIPLTDSLALYNLFATLDPSLNTASAASISKITDILKASSNDAAKSLETTLDAVGKVFGQTFTTTIDDRESYYAHLNQVQALFNPAFSVSYTVVNLAGMDAATLAANASDPANTAYRYALRELNSFVVVGTDYNSFNQNGELSLYDPATHTGTLTEQYLKDRSAFLVDKIIANAQDNLSNGMGYVDYAGTKQYFRDEGGATPTTVVLGGSKVANLFITQPPNNIQQIRFGSGSVADTFQGGAKNDHLYGMGGNDTLQGNGGSDYLEGGQGSDKYIWNNGDGLDIISDTDGLGSIAINGHTLANGESRDGGHTYTGKDGSGTEHIYAVLAGDINAAAGATLLIDGAAKILNYRQGDLGIILDGGPAVQQSTTLITGDLAPIVYGTDSQGNPVYHYDALGNRIVDPGKPGAVDDILYGSSGGDQIISGAGSDFVNSNDGADLIEGGMGADILAGGNGDDRLYAGSETGVADAIAAGNSQTGSGLKGDWLAGGAGDDAMIAGADGDVLSGGAGSDLLIAGAGNDYILGDADYVAQSFDWTVTPQAGIYDFQPAIGATDPAGSGSDIIYAGGGNDHAWAGGGADAVYGEGGNDTLSATGGGNTLDGGAGTIVLDLGNGYRDAANDECIAHHQQYGRRVA